MMVHTAIRALLRELPKQTGPWTKSEKQAWLEAFEKVIDLLYPDAKGDE